MVVEEKGNLQGIKGLNKGEKLKQLTSCHVKQLKNGSLKNDVESICNIHL
jgi:hypothetical protein